MKKPIVTILAVSLLGCSTTNSKWIEQAFGDALRSTEGTVAADQIPTVIMSLRNKWLPPGKQWDNLAGSLIHQFVNANPQNNVEVNKILEQLAMQLQTGTPVATPVSLYNIKIDTRWASKDKTPVQSEARFVEQVGEPD